MVDSRASSAASAVDSAPETPVAVLLPLPLAGAYNYAATEALRPGDFVVVPLGSREVAGVVWDGAAGGLARHRLRQVIARLAVPPLPEVSRRFVEWVADYTLSSPGAVLRMAMSVSSAFDRPRPIAAWRLAPGGGKATTLTTGRRRVLSLLADGPPRALREIAREAGVGVGVVKALAAAGWLAPATLPPPPAFARLDPRRQGPVLSKDQGAAAAELGEKIGAGYSATLLDGVTGAGKTEVYFEAIAAALGAGRQALALLPEIALGAEWLKRFAARFGARPAAWHSDLGQRERRLAWRAIATGEARVVVGARSALFLPYPELGLIVVDEEHDGAYKQEEGVIYQARDMAVVRARLSAIPIVLVSATPSL